MATSKQAGLTPARNLHLKFDYTDTVTLEPAFFVSRSGTEIARGGAGPNNSVNMKQLDTGGWRMRWTSDMRSNIAEFGDQLNAALKAGDFTLAQNIVLQYRNRPPSDIPGAVVNPLAVVGDPFFIQSPPAGQSYPSSSLNGDAAAYPHAAPAGGVTPMNRVAVSKASFDANQPFVFRFEVPSNGVNTPGYFAGFMFGGSETGGGFDLGFYGNGVCILRQLVGGIWVERDRWRIGSASGMRGYHMMMMTPYVNPLTGQGYIEFESDIADAPPVGNLGLSTIVAPNSTHRYPVQTLPLNPSPSTPGKMATAAGKARVNHLGHMRMPWAVEVPRYLSPATLTDMPFMVTAPISTRTNFTLRWTAEIPAGTSCDAKLYDAKTGAECTQVGGGTSYKIYTPNTGTQHYYVVFTLTSDTAKKSTPILWNYTVSRDGWLANSTLTPFLCPENGGILHTVSITGGERDPSHESLAFEFDDPTLAYPALGVRCSQRLRIETEYDSSNPALRSVLFDGYLGSAKGRRKTGALREGISGGQMRQYPNQYWKRYECTAVGMWQRLHEMLTMNRYNFSIDQNAELSPDTGNPQAWKVVDAIRALIVTAGFNAGQIDVPDNPVRFFASSDGNGSQLTLDPLSNIAEAVGRFSKDYLGQFITWDGNAGADGMWRLIKPSVPPYQNLAIFRTGAPGTGAVHLSSTYNGGSTAAYVGSLTSPVTTYIRSGTLVSYVIPPEGNMLTVTGSGQLIPNGGGALNLTNFAINPLSYDFTTSPTSDPTNADYLGRMVPIVVYDTGLTTDMAVGLVAKRIYQQACQGIKMMSFDAPLVLVVDPRDNNQRSPRPLRYYDAVQVVSAGVTSQWLVRNCNPYIHKSGFSWAHYELEAPRNVLPGL